MWKLVDAHWVRRSDRWWEIYRVLSDVKSWNDLWASPALELAANPKAGGRLIQMLIRQIDEPHLAVAAKLLGARIRCELNYISKQEPEFPDPPPPYASEADQRWASWKRQDSARKPFRDLLRSGDWYRVPEAAKRAPRAFLEEIWPPILKVVELIAPEGSRRGYREIPSLLFDFESTHDRSGGSLLSIVLAAVETYGENDLEGFCDFVRANESSDLALVHRFLARGLTRAARAVPSAALAYLLAERQRLAIGDMHDAMERRGA